MKKFNFKELPGFDENNPEFIFCKFTNLDIIPERMQDCYYSNPDLVSVRLTRFCVTNEIILEEGDVISAYLIDNEDRDIIKVKVKSMTWNLNSDCSGLFDIGVNLEILGV